jgi:hypothetical protein
MPASSETAELLAETIEACAESLRVLVAAQQICRSQLEKIGAVGEDGRAEEYDAALAMHLVWLTNETLRLSAEVRRLRRIAAFPSRSAT